MTKSVIHLIPFDGIGGVEIAARSIRAGDHNGLSFRRCYIVRTEANVTPPPDWHGKKVSKNSPTAHLAALRYLMKSNPDLVIASLWRSCFVLLALRLLRPRLKSVLFLHLPHDVHWIDWALNRLAMRTATEVWADSNATLVARVPAHLMSRGRVISFLTERRSETGKTNPKPHFIFWGRLHTQKGLERAISLFARIHERNSAAKFDVIGPDGGERAYLEKHAEALGLKGVVKFLGPMTREELFERASDASFYLQTSVEEGMALSVIEAMQLGLVPVVTPVGEVQNYCQDGQNAIVLREDEKMGARVVKLLSMKEEYAALSSAAVRTWESKPIYREDMLEACRDLLKGPA